MEFPRIVHKRGGAYLFVADEAEYAAALAEGWVHSSRVFDGVAVEPTVEAVASVSTPADVPDPHPVPKKRGRPRKVE